MRREDSNTSFSQRENVDVAGFWRAGTHIWPSHGRAVCANRIAVGHAKGVCEGPRREYSRRGDERKKKESAGKPGSVVGQSFL
jgi:hypothetical protein